MDRGGKGGWSVERGEKGMEGSGLGIKGKMGGIGICERVGERGKKGGLQDLSHIPSEIPRNK